MRRISIILIIFILFVTINLTAQKRNMYVGNTPSNINNGGIVAVDGKWEYFWAGTTRWGFHGGKFCKMKIDGSEFQVLTDDVPAFINVVDDWIYYIKRQGPVYRHRGTVYKMKKDGTERQKISNVIGSNMTVVGKWIYFINQSDGNTIYKMKTDGSGMTRLINKKCFNLQYENEILYFEREISPDNYGVFKYSLNSNSKPVKIVEKTVNFIVNNEWIYYSYYPLYNKKGIYRIRNDGTEYSQVVSKDLSYSFAVSGDYIYGSDVNQHLIKGKGLFSNFYKISLDGTGIKALPNVKGFERENVYGITDNHIYYSVDCAEWFEIARMQKNGTDNKILINKLKQINN